AFLRHYPFLKRLAVDVHGLKSFAGIESIASSAELLSLEATASKKMSLSFLSKFTRLRELYLKGHAKDIEALSGLASLERLTLRSITLPDLSILTSLKTLWWLALKLGGTRNLSLLPEVGGIKYLELWMIRGLTDISMISELHRLQYLYLQDLKHVRTFPSCKGLQRLRTVYMENMKGLKDLSPLVAARHLQNLAVSGANHMEPSDFDVLTGHPSLKGFSAGLGSDKKNKAVSERFRLPPANCRLAEFIFE
ncbi:MAG: hypothetical protein AAB380_01835, partial [Verrucomicrobiota bacterium]